MSSNMYDDNFLESEYLNLCLVGCVSAGKSTILNAFFGQDYAQCKIKRTTMIPNKFIETNDLEKIDNQETINNLITQVNNLIYSVSNEEPFNQHESKNLNKLDLDNYGGELIFNVENMEMNISKKIKICIYDIPGLNDAKTSDVYYEYLSKNFHKFNIILFVVDINSGLNTSDEINILNFLAEHIQKHKTISKKNIHMITIVNKADELQLNNDKFELLGEYQEMFQQTENSIKIIFKKYNIEDNLIDVIPICGISAHLYRMIKKFKDVNKLSREHILRIGIDDEGGKFKRLNESEQKLRVQQKINDFDFVDDMIKLSGFLQIEKILNRFINIHGNKLISENILLKYNKIPELTLNNLVSTLDIKIKCLEKLISFDYEIYQEHMRILFKQFNNIIYKHIINTSEPNNVKDFYDKIIIKIKQNIRIEIINPFINLIDYPIFICERIIELILDEFKNNKINIIKLSYFELINSIGYLDSNIADTILETICNNPRDVMTFYTDSNYDFDKIKNILLLIQISNHFLHFIRFLLSNIYNGLNLESLIMKKMLFIKFGEIPMCEFINNLIIEKKYNNKNKEVNKINKLYTNININTYAKENLLELYYIYKAKLIEGSDNFILTYNNNKLPEYFNTIIEEKEKEKEKLKL